MSNSPSSESGSHASLPREDQELPAPDVQQLSQRLQNLSGHQGGASRLLSRLIPPQQTQTPLFLPGASTAPSPEPLATQELPPPPFPSSAGGEVGSPLLGLSVASPEMQHLLSPASPQVWGNQGAGTQLLAPNQVPLQPTASVSLPAPVVGLSTAIAATNVIELELHARFAGVYSNFHALDCIGYGTGYLRFLKVYYFETICHAVNLTQSKQSRVMFCGMELTRRQIAQWLGQPFGTLNNWRTYYTNCQAAYNTLSHHNGQLARDGNEELLWQVLRRWVESGDSILSLTPEGDLEAHGRSWHMQAVAVKANKIGNLIGKLKEKPVYATLM